jgi:hypothetical protein
LKKLQGEVLDATEWTRILETDRREEEEKAKSAKEKEDKRAKRAQSQQKSHTANSMAELHFRHLMIVKDGDGDFEELLELLSQSFCGEFVPSPVLENRLRSLFESQQGCSDDHVKDDVLQDEEDDVDD